MNTDVDRCGKCFARLELLVNQADQTPTKQPNRYNLFVKEHFHTMKDAQPHLSTPQLMKHISQEYKKTLEELPNLEQLKF